MSYPSVQPSCKIINDTVYKQPMIYVEVFVLGKSCVPRESRD